MKSIASLLRKPSPSMGGITICSTSPEEDSRKVRTFFEQIWGKRKESWAKEVLFKLEYSDGVGGFSPMFHHEDFNDVSVNGGVVWTITPGRRRMLGIKTASGLVVVYERYGPQDRRQQYVAAEAPEAVERFVDEYFQKGGLDSAIVESSVFKAIIDPEKPWYNIGTAMYR